MGVGVSTAVPAVGSVVPHAEANLGAIATQASTEPTYGIRGLELLKKGLSPRRVLDKLLEMDPEREARQVAIIDVKGRSAAYTGKNTVECSGHIIGADYVVAGNMLRNESVLDLMAEAFENSTGSLSERILGALEAGERAGGDKRGKLSAALIVVGGEVTGPRPSINLRVDYHRDPVHELRWVFEAYKKWPLQV